MTSFFFYLRHTAPSSLDWVGRRSPRPLNAPARAAACAKPVSRRRVDLFLDRRIVVAKFLLVVSHLQCIRDAMQRPSGIDVHVNAANELFCKV